jgi:phosphoglycerate dehydrogenase-like enzyme
MMPPSKLVALKEQRARVVQAQTLGYDGVAGFLREGTVFCNAVDVHEASTAELTLALVLASLRGLPDLLSAQASGDWAHAQYPGLAGRRILLIGVGGVGAEIEKRLTPFDVLLTRMARTAREDDRGSVLGMESLSVALGETDVVILAVPLGPETKHLVSTDFIGAMKAGALLVNVSRGAVVDTDALVVALNRGAISAALDVTDPEPLPPDHPLWATPNTIVTPHVGGHTGAMGGRIERLIKHQIDRLLSGEELLNIVLDSRIGNQL